MVISALPVVAELILRIFLEESSLISFSVLAYSLFALSATGLARSIQYRPNSPASPIFILAIAIQLLLAVLGTGHETVSPLVWWILLISLVLTIIGSVLAWRPVSAEQLPEGWY
jgi:hypothetical protein